MSKYIMKTILSIFSLVLANCVATHLPPPPSNMVSLRTDLSLANYLLSQQTAAATGASSAVSDNVDATTSAQCFNIYLPLLNDVANNWSVNYSSCVSNATAERNAVMTKMQNERNTMANAATDICQYVKNCQNIADEMEFFNCFSEFSTSMVSTIYTVSNNASDDATYMFQQLDAIDVDMYSCTNDSERAYIEKTVEVYDALDYCLHNGLPPIYNPTTVEPKETTEATADSTDLITAATTTTTAIADMTTVKAEVRKAKRSLSFALAKMSRRFGF